MRSPIACELGTKRRSTLGPFRVVAALGTGGRRLSLEHEGPPAVLAAPPGETPAAVGATDGGCLGVEEPRADEAPAGRRAPGQRLRVRDDRSGEEIRDHQVEGSPDGARRPCPPEHVRCAVPAAVYPRPPT